MQFARNDIQVTVTLPKEQRLFYFKIRHDEVETIACHRERIWIGILNRSLSENILIHKNKPF